jgi:hypothetical protein
MAPCTCHHHAFQMALCRPTMQAGTAAFSALPTGHLPQIENVTFLSLHFYKTGHSFFHCQAARPFENVILLLNL